MRTTRKVLEDARAGGSHPLTEVVRQALPQPYDAAGRYVGPLCYDTLVQATPANGKLATTLVVGREFYAQYARYWDPLGDPQQQGEVACTTPYELYERIRRHIVAESTRRLEGTDHAPSGIDAVSTQHALWIYVILLTYSVGKLVGKTLIDKHTVRDFGPNLGMGRLIDLMRDQRATCDVIIKLIKYSDFLSSGTPIQNSTFTFGGSDLNEDKLLVYLSNIYKVRLTSLYDARLFLQPLTLVPWLGCYNCYDFFARHSPIK